MEDFQLKWRFTEEKYNVLPQNHLNQLKPLDKVASNFLSEFLSKVDIHADVPFKKTFFKIIDHTCITDGNENEIRKWLYQRGIQFAKEVYLSWSEDVAMIAPWKLIVKYFDDFQYADDLTVFDKSLNWALLFFHEGDVYFGSNENYVSVDISKQI